MLNYSRSNIIFSLIHVWLLEGGLLYAIFSSIVLLTSIFSSRRNFDPLILLIDPQSEYAIRQSTTSRTLLRDNTDDSEHCRHLLTVTDNNDNDIEIVSTRGSNLGELYYEVKEIISRNSRVIEWVDCEPECKNELRPNFLITSPKNSSKFSHSMKSRKSKDIL